MKTPKPAKGLTRAKIDKILSGGGRGKKLSRDQAYILARMFIEAEGSANNWKVFYQGERERNTCDRFGCSDRIRALELERDQLSVRIESNISTMNKLTSELVSQAQLRLDLSQAQETIRNLAAQHPETNLAMQSERNMRSVGDSLVSSLLSAVEKWKRLTKAIDAATEAEVEETLSIADVINRRDITALFAMLPKADPNGGMIYAVRKKGSDRPVAVFQDIDDAEQYLQSKQRFAEPMPPNDFEITTFSDRKAGS